MQFFKKFVLPVSLMVGTIIGAGIFSLPYAISKSGLITGSFFIALVTVIASIMHLMYADIILTTPDHHNRFPGYAKKYLGESYLPWANAIIFATLLLTLTAYLALSVSFAGLLFPDIPMYIRVFIFWFLGSLAIFLDIRRAAEFEFLTSFLTLSIIGAIFIMGASASPLAAAGDKIFNPGEAMVPFGPVLFSILGLTAVPPILAYAREEKLSPQKVKRIIIWGTALPAIFYFLFVLGIWGLTDEITTDSVTGLIGNAPRYILVLLGIFGFVSLWDSYATIGTDIKKNLEYEHLGLSETAIGLVAIFAPLILYFLGLQNFLKLVSVIGGLFFSIRSVMTIFIWKNARAASGGHHILKKAGPATIYFLLIVFGFAIIYQLIKFLS